jgi:hypothetical protein
MDALERWTDFNVAMAGATAALAGLVIVAASVNIAEIVKARSLTARLGAAIASLVLAILGSGSGLIPGMTPSVYGIVVVACAAGASVFAIDATRQVSANHHPENRAKAGRAVVAFFAPALYAAGGIILVAGGEIGLVVVAVGAFSAIVTALLVSWIVLVEVLR